jgi:L-histidine N-alpha-methyltransferase
MSGRCDVPASSAKLIPDMNIEIFDYEPPIDDFRAAFIAGMSTPQKEIPSKFIYDKHGSEIFSRIVELPEYYVPRAELGILEDRAEEIAALVGPRCYLLGYGSAASIKVRCVLNALDEPAVYAPLDISKEILVEGGDAIARDYPTLRVCAICADYTQAFELPMPDGVAIGRKTGFFPGSTIANVSIEEMLHFFENAAALLGVGGALIVGVDLKKDAALIHTAYNDSAGVSASFQRNLLFRANRELGTEFDTEGFRHQAEYNAEVGRVEIGLVSLKDQSVLLDGREFTLARDELILTQFAYKFSIDEFQALAARAGFESEAAWTDREEIFACHMLRVG